MRIHYRPIEPGEEVAAAAVVEAAFDKHIAPGFSEQGIEEFRRYAHAQSIRARREGQPPHFQVVALATTDASDARIVGIGEIREWRHVSMLFVHPDRAGAGIGRQLLAQLLAAARRESPSIRQLTVNSSPFAVPIYERFGFQIAGPSRVIKGIDHIPMTLALD